jgi:signal transduction histidine kinase
MKWIAWLGTVLAAGYWFLEALMESSFFNEGTFIERMWPTSDAHEMWMRTTVVILLFCFGIYSQFLVDRLRRAKDRLLHLNGCFLSFGTDPVENINLLTAQCGELLHASAAFYNRLDRERLRSWGRWKAPADMPSESSPKGHICHEVIKQSSGNTVVIKNLPSSAYASSDPSVTRYDLKTYMGKAVKLGDSSVGSLCVVYQKDYQPSPDDEQLLGIIASAVGVEEERRRALEALRESEERLRHLSSELLITQEMERKRLAQQLHDSVGQALSALKFGIEETLDALHGEVDDEKINPLRATVPMIREVVNEIRAIQSDLRPSMIDDLGIVTTMDTFCKQFQEIYKTIRVQTQVEIEEQEIPKQLKIVIYRILQEAMNNVAKHSRAQIVHICFRREADSIQLVVQDDGRGIDMTREAEGNFRKGLGLSSMKERAELSGGAFTIKSREMEGTRIEAKWPLKEGSFSPL